MSSLRNAVKQRKTQSNLFKNHKALFVTVLYTYRIIILRISFSVTGGTLLSEFATEILWSIIYFCLFCLLTDNNLSDNVS